jgi:hypothetical protein
MPGAGDKAEQAYRRSDALEKRRKLMDAWAAYCEPKGTGNVVQIGKLAALIRRLAVIFGSADRTAI